ncbi:MULTISPECIES: hypothetical protein [Halomonadaceae]|uniref:hypothetical protein n=1 Tax=Halomonadaceae TaxID=28256 RepID=UPI00159A4278|nr:MULTISPECIES: hypothetical protein [Halomonas]QJQ96275.1 hypothetical protein HIO72_14035 [Halomonas sp. PA5]
MGKRYQVVQASDVEGGPQPSEHTSFRIKDTEADKIMPGEYETRDLAEDECNDLNAKFD